jgi:hypothetical protein
MEGVARTEANFYFGNQSNNNVYFNLNGDGAAQTTFWQFGGYGTYIAPTMSGRGDAIYPFVCDQCAAHYIDPFTDIEDTESNLLADMWINSWTRAEIDGAELIVNNGTPSFLKIGDGAGVSVLGGSFSGNPTEIVDIASPPSAQVILRDTSFAALGYWKGYTAYSLDKKIRDSNGNVEQVTTAGTSGSSQPTWVTTIGHTTTDGSTLVWTLETLRTNASYGQYLSIVNGDKAEESSVSGLPTCAAINRDVTWDVADCDFCAFGASCLHTTGKTFCREVCNGSAWVAQ